jgi:hypothetical protein
MAGALALSIARVCLMISFSTGLKCARTNQSGIRRNPAPSWNSRFGAPPVAFGRSPSCSNRAAVLHHIAHRIRTPAKSATAPPGAFGLRDISTLLEVGERRAVRLLARMGGRSNRNRQPLPSPASRGWRANQLRTWPAAGRIANAPQKTSKRVEPA